ncbi:MAG: hydrogenase maturation protease [Chloroflexi bacterium]|nr:hydrogenase maturation protease [Chloroflexota bacterium]
MRGAGPSKNEAVLVIGAGQPWRGDDGVGPALVRELRLYFSEHPDLAQLRPRLEEANDGLVDFLESSSGYSKVILVDAVVTGSPPGTLHRWEVAQKPLPASLRACSTHGFDLGGAIELYRALNMLPRSLVIYGIEAGQFETGSDLSPAVKAAIPACQARLLEDLTLYSRQPSPPTLA